MITHCLTALSLTARAAMIVWAAANAIPAARAATAGDSSSTSFVERQVSLAGLDLASPSGQAELRHRIGHAARQVCREVTDNQSYAEPEFRDCVQAAFADAWGAAEKAIASAERAARVTSASAK